MSIELDYFMFIVLMVLINGVDGIGIGKFILVIGIVV